MNGPEDGVTPEDVAAMRTLVEGTPQSTPDEILRGFEVVRWNMWTRSWDQNSAFRGNELALRQAANELTWLQGRYPNEKYELRALVSVPRKEST